MPSATLFSQINNTSEALNFIKKKRKYQLVGGNENLVDFLRGYGIFIMGS